MQQQTLEQIAAHARADEEDDRNVVPGEARGLLHWTRRLEGDLQVLQQVKTNAEPGLDDLGDADLNEVTGHSLKLAADAARAYDALAAERARRRA